MMEIKTLEELKKLFSENQDKLVILDFYADWCTPCRILGEYIDALSMERNDFILAKINIEEADELANEYKIRNLPTLIFTKNGFIIDKSVGAIGKDMLNDKINENLNK